MFNVRIKHFCDTKQVQVFSRVQRSSGERFKVNCDLITGEIKPPKERGEMILNPFTGQVERMTEYRPQSAEMVSYKSAVRTRKTIYDIARSDCWDWFFTLTFDPKKIDRYDYDVCSKKLHYWLSNMHKKAPYMKYLVVPEQHKDGAWHFHGLFKNVDGLDFRFSGKRDRRNRRIYNVDSYRWGFTTATRISDFRRASSYLCKYVTKDLCLHTKGKKRYWCSRNVERPVVSDFLIDGDYEELLVKIFGDVPENSHVKQIEVFGGKITYIDYDSQSIRKTCEVFTESAE